MTKLEELESARDAAWDTYAAAFDAWDAARADDTRAAAVAAGVAYTTASAAYYEELEKIQEEKQDD
jgi:hypothetical protein